MRRFHRGNEMKNGSQVQLKQPVISGVVVETEYDQSACEIRHLVEFDKDGETHKVWFLQSQLDEVVQ
jgi:hypothetical protein